MAQSKKSLRYDRILFLIILPIIVIYIAYMVFFAGNDDDGKGKRKIEKFNPIVYLSPSNEKKNSYSAYGVTEAKAMMEISRCAEKFLSDSGIEVHITEYDYSLKKKVDYANENSFTVHVAIHSNDGSEKKKGEGTKCFYNGNVEGSKQLSEYVYNHVAEYTPTIDRGVINAAEGKEYIFEIAESEVPSCLVEVEYHNTTELAKWIVDNTEGLGKAVADGIMDYLKTAEEEYYSQFTDGEVTENGK